MDLQIVPLNAQSDTWATESRVSGIERTHPMPNVVMNPVDGCQLSKAWFTASTRKLESLLPYLCEEDQEKVYDELDLRDHETQLSPVDVPPDELDYPHNQPAY